MSDYWNQVSPCDKKHLPKCNFPKCRNYMELVNRWTCSYCKNIFCSGHRMYENHNCAIYNEIKTKQNNSGTIFHSQELSHFEKMFKMSKVVDNLIKDIKDISDS